MGNRKGLFQWSLALVAVIFQFTAQLITAGLVMDITNYFHASASQAGFMLSSYYILYAMMQVPAGAVVSRFGPKFTFIMGHILFALSSLILIFAPNLYMAFLGRILMGLSLGCHYVSFAKATDQNIPAIYFGSFIALQELLVVIFQIVFNLSLASVANIQWQSVIIILSVSSFMLSIFFTFTMKPIDKKGEHERLISLMQIKLIVGQILKDKDLMYKTLIASCLFSFLTIIYGTWWPTFLVAARNVSIGHALVSNQVLAFGMVLGMAYLLSSSSINNTKNVLISYGIASALCLLVLLWWPTMPEFLVNIFMLLMGFFSSAYCLGFTELGSKPYPKAVSVGFVNGAMLMIAPIIQTMIAGVSELFHCYYVMPNTSVSLVEYQLDLTILPIIQLVILALYVLNIKRSSYISDKSI
ncbi:MAG: MFS transporter [Gammaproteobacteria bacterium]|nr:MFS transporter [Gammaproteobacteria bacterium]